MNWEPGYMLPLLWYCNMNTEEIICPCFKVTKGDIINAVEEGANSFRDVKKMTKVGKGCGKCKKTAKKFTKKMLKKLD